MNPGTANFLSGGLASNAFWISSFPFDAVKKCVSLTSREQVASPVDSMLTPLSFP